MNPYQLFQTDSKMETEGLWLDYGDFKIRIARAGGANQKYAKLLAEKTKPFRRRFDNGTMDNAAAEKILAETYAEAVVLGWENVPNRAGEPLAFNKENCIALFLDLPELFRDVQEQAARVANFRAQELEDDAKN